jgi:hypothetical protein
MSQNLSCMTVSEVVILIFVYMLEVALDLVSNVDCTFTLL